MVKTGEDLNRLHSCNKRPEVYLTLYESLGIILSYYVAVIFSIQYYSYLN